MDTNAIEVMSNEPEETPGMEQQQEAPDDTGAASAGAEEETTGEKDVTEKGGQKAPMTVKVTHLGKQIDFDPTTDEGRAVIQKGLNYDHMAEKAKKNPDTEIITELAKRSGMDVETYREFVRDHYHESSVRAEQEKLQEEYPDADPKLIRKLAEANAGKKEGGEDRRMAELLEEFPEIKSVDDIPDKVKEALGKGEDGVKAMLRYQLEEARSAERKAAEAAKIAEKTAANRGQSTGSMKTRTGTAEQDPEKMTYEQYKAWRRRKE